VAAKKKPSGANRSWGGRFKDATAANALSFTASIGFDVRLYPYDIRTSIAHARMLAATKIISAADRDTIVAGLLAVEKELDDGTFVPTDSDEDIHMAVERRLTEKIGAVGARLHAARSRNDQVVTDVRLFLKDAIAATHAAVEDLRTALIEQAEAHIGAIMPGYTHLQRAQPILLAHHLLAYYDMLERDLGRLADCLTRNDVLPLGSGALAGTTLPIDREMVARELGFSRIAENSIDAISSRDFVLEYLSTVAILMTHTSRLASDITLWATSEFGFVKLDDAYSTGSSMMPQKKNPDIAELARGKSGRAFGNLMAVLTAVKGLPLAYNSDLQEDKEALFDSVDTAVATNTTLAAMLRSLSFDEEAMRAAADDGFLLATDLAEYLVAGGMPFREAHEVTGGIVLHCTERGITPTDLSAEELAALCDRFGADVADILTPEAAVDRRISPGGTSGRNVSARLRKLARPSTRK
jgi:argininosuccinate lyase